MSKCYEVEIDVELLQDALERAESRILELHRDHDEGFSYETLGKIRDAIKNIKQYKKHN